MKSKVILCGGAAMFLLAQASAQVAPATGRADSNGLQTGPATVPPHWSRNKYPDSIPEGATYYLVVRGDTLWDISKRFLGNPYLWPQVWDQNRYISDAHWIYPGDPIILPKVSLVSDRAGQTEEPMPEEGMPGESGLPGASGSLLFPVTEEVTMQCAPFVVQDREDESFRIIGSEQGSLKLAFGDRDILYLNKGSNAGVKPGDLFTIHRSMYKVKHPTTGKTLGTKIDTNGWVRVLLVQENSSTAIVEQACKDIHNGEYLKSYEKVNVPLALRRPPADRLTEPTGKIQGYVVDIQEDLAAAAAGHLVTIDMGNQTGIAPGNMLVVYRIMYPSVPTSRNVVGEIAVLAVRERTAVAKITYSSDAIVNGDQVELR